MENFQLYRTNILLSGQVKWDLILDLDQSNNELYVKDLHLSPISYSASYNRLPEESLLNYSHQENLKKYYKKTESIFFDSCINPQLKHDWVVIDNNKYDIVEDSFDAGARNAKYSIYNKSIEILCPVWLEKVTNDVQFIIDVYANTGKKIISKPIKLNKNGFDKYLNNYITYLGLNHGVDDVLNVDLKNKKTTLTGISLESGNIVKIDIPGATQNLLHRERTLLEFDSLLINNFSNNKIISRQLFNFCFYLNLNDLMPEKMADMMYGNTFAFKVRTIVDGVELNIMDFYSNYEYIEKEIIHHIKLYDLFSDNYKPYEYKQNVLDYLMDYKYINHINKNKYVQNIVHWSLNDNPGYIFNIYNGFGPYEPIDDETGYFYSHRYGKTPDLIYKDYNKSLNNTGWCNLVELDSIEDWKKIIYNENCYNKLKYLSSNFKPKWVNNVLYDENISNSIQWDELRMIIISVNSDVYNDIKSSIQSNIFNDYKFLTLDDNVCYIRFNYTDEFIGIIVNNACIDYVTFKQFNELLNNYIESCELIKDHPLYYIQQKLNSVKQIPLVILDKSLYIVNAASPSISTNEIEYYKNDNIPIDECYVLRYDGKIKPTFLNREDSELKNIIYFKSSKSEHEYLSSSFIKYAESSYPPLFPSIGYCAVESKPQTFTKWDKCIPIVNPYIDVALNSKRDMNGNLIKIKELVEEYITNLYPELNSYDIYSIYNIESSYDYKSDSNINDYLYKINMTLK